MSTDPKNTTDLLAGALLSHFAHLRLHESSQGGSVVTNGADADAHTVDAVVNGNREPAEAIAAAERVVGWAIEHLRTQ